jgi:trimeric autotransporter adhesin
MRRPPHHPEKRAARASVAEDPRRSEAGDTLIEVLLALVILGLASVALLLAFATSIAGSAEHRTLATADTVLRTVAEETISQMQQNSSGAFACPSTFTASPSVPTGYTVSSVTVQYWSSATSSFSSSNPCVANTPQLVTITVTANGVSYSISVVVEDPVAPAVATATTATKLVFLSQPSGNEVAGVSLPLVVAVEGSNGGIVTSDLSPVTLAVTTGPSGTTLTNTCSGIEYDGVVTFNNCALTQAGTGYSITASEVTPSGVQNLTPSTTGTFNVVAASPAQFAFTSAPVSGVAAASALLGPITVQEQDAYGNPTTAAETVNLTSSSTGSFIFSTSSGGAAVGSISIPAGSSSASFYYGDTMSGSPVLTASGALTSDTQAETITAGPATQVSITPNPAAVATSNTTNVALGLQLEDQFGNNTTSSGTTTLALSSPSTTDFFSAYNGVSATLGNTINATFFNGAGTTTVYYGDELVETATITAKNGSATWGTASVVVNAGAATKVAITASPATATASGTTNVALNLQLEDQFGNNATSSGTTTLTLSSPSATDFFASSMGATGTPGNTTSATFTTGVGTATIYYGDQGAETDTITAKKGSSTWGTVSVTVTPAAAAQVIITPSPLTATASGTTNVTLGLQLQDQFGNNTTSSGTTTLTLTSPSTTDFFTATGGASGTLGNTINATFANGVGTATVYYGDEKAETDTITALNGSTPWGSASVSITAGTATKLIFTTSPSATATGGTAFATQPVVSVEDVFGNTVTTNGTGVTLAITGGTGTSGAVLACTTNPVTAASGVAAFTNCSINKSGAGYTLTATDGTLTAATSSAITITVGPATQLVFTTQPVGGVNEATNFAASPKVTVEDAGGNTVTADTGPVALSIASYTAGNGGSASGTLTCNPGSPVNAVAGVATFTNCQISGTAGAGTYTLTATRTGLTAATSSNVVITAGGANKLAFTTQPVGAVPEASNFATQPVVTVEDINGNTVTTDNGTVALSIGTYAPGNGGTTQGTLACTPASPINAAAGVATFAGCKITGTAAAGTYTLSATRTGLIAGTSSNVVITAGAPTKLVITTQPSGGANGIAFGTQPVVTVEDVNGDTVTSSTASVSLAIATQPGSGAALACTPASPINAVAGVATFSGCNIVGKTGSYTLTATSTGLTSATSSAITITVGSATQLVFTTQPVGGVNEATNFATQPVVTVEDAGGNTVTTDTGTVALSIASYNAGNGGSAQGTLACTPTSPVNAVAGVATFTNCQITGTAGAGTYTLSATRTGLATATSSNLTITAGGANQLAFTTQPVGGVNEATNFATQPVVTVEDTNGNTVTTDTGTVALTIASYTAGNGGTTQGTLACTPASPINAAAGVATFAGCKITGTGGAGTYTLSATRSGLATATSSNVTITAGSATKLVFTTSPGASTTATPFATQPVVAVEDTNGNIVTTNNTASVTLAVNSGTGTLGACTTNPLTVTNGVATFGACKITLGSQGNFTLKATATGLTTGTSSSFTVAGAAAKLGFATSPGASTGGSAFGTQPVVWVEDSSGDLVTTNNTASVTLAVNSGTGTLGGCTANPVTVTNGVATFGNCKITLGSQGNFTLNAAATGLTTATSSSFTVAGAATKLVFTTQPVGGTHNTPFATQPVVSVEDSSGDVVTTSAASITLAIGTNPGGGTLTCTTNPLAATNGVSTFAGCSITTAGNNYTLKATATGLTTATSSTFNLS